MTSGKLFFCVLAIAYLALIGAASPRARVRPTN